MKLPDPITKRDILHGRRSAPEELARLGDAFFAAERLQEACEFYLAAASQEGLDKVRDWCLEHGDLFLFEKIEKSRGEAGGFPDQMWARLGDRARETGKLRWAARAFERAGDRKKLEAVLRMQDAACGMQDEGGNR